MYYGSTSAWNSSYSAVFLLTSDTVDHGYKYQQIIVKTQDGDSTNAIDSCVYYGHNSDGTINPSELYCLYGSWGDIMVKSVNADGTRSDGERDFGNLLSVARSGGEGGYMTYDSNSKYYYYYISPEANGWAGSGGRYNIRVYRSTEPDSGFEAYNGNKATEQTDLHGNGIITAYTNDAVPYTYTSVGHSSVYTAYNNDGDSVLINAAHTRENSKGDLPVEDGQLSTRQIWLVGNVAVHNPVAYTANGWPTAFPLQYNNTFSLKNKTEVANGNRTYFTASDIEGVYSANVLSRDGTTSSAETFNLVASGADEGTLVNTTNSKGQPFKLTYSENNDVTYITLYHPGHMGDENYVHGYGVIANQNGTPEFSYIIAEYNSGWNQQNQHVWGVRTKAYPRDVTNPDGEVNVELDGVIYTHATDAEVLAVAGLNNSSSAADKAAALASGYAVYGQEISDNEDYLKSGGADERVTTIKVKYPYYIDESDPNAIICLNDADFVAEGYTTGKYKAELIGYYTTEDSNADGKDDSFATLSDYQGSKDNDAYAFYKITGNVSNYFAYRNGAYQETGLQLLIQYTNAAGDKYGEYKFPYVTYNPAWAHTLAATRNLKIDNVAGIGTNNYQSSYGIFNRFENSYGESTDYYSSMLYYASRGTTDEVGYGDGVSGYLGNFSNITSSDTSNPHYKDLSELSYIKTLYNFYDKDKGVNSGSFAAWTHEDNGYNAYTASPDLINVNYYIDYSDTQQYQNNNGNGLITTNANGVPTGYQFKMRTSNFLWKNYSDSSIFGVTSYAKNTTGLKVSYSSSNENLTDYGKGTYADSYNSLDDKAKAAGNYYTNFDHINTDVPFGGKKRWYDDAFLFFAEHRDGSYMGYKTHSNSRFTQDYRNKLLYYFSDGTSAMLRPDTDQKTNYIDDVQYKDGTEIRSSVYNYSNNKAYSTAPNGKGDTNSWWGVATFTGKDTVKANDINTLYDTYKDNTSGVVGGIDSNGQKRLYDGYYYYHTVKDYYKEDWTADYDTASAVDEWGKLDVTAENMANYILEMGSYHKITDISRGGGSLVGNETYHYYNIGVNTCDKGAVRELLDTWANNKVNITKDANGRITALSPTGAGGKTEAISASEYTVESYNDYLDAVAEAYWFLNNPKNTTYVSSQDGKTYSYSTAYAEFNNEKHAAIYTDDIGENIFGENTAASGAYTDQNNAVYTDEVQARLIKNVLDAYENLFNINDYKTAEDIYGSIEITTDKEENDTITIYEDADKEDVSASFSKANYTDDSWNNFVALVKNVSKNFDYYTDDSAQGDKKQSDIDYWRYVSLTGEEYKQLEAILTDAKTSLMPKVDTERLGTVITDKEALTADGINKGGDSQYYTYDSWKQLTNELETANGYIADASGKSAYDIYDTDNNLIKKSEDVTEAEKFSNGQYKVDKAVKYEFNNYEFIAQEFTAVNGGINSANYTDADKASCVSALQKNVYDEYAILNAKVLSQVDNDEAYQNYNSAQAYTSRIDRSVYTSTALSAVDGLRDLGYYISNTNKYAPDYTVGSTAVYVKDNDTIYQNSATSATDAKTAYVLNTLNDIDAAGEGETHLKTSTINFYQVVDGVVPAEPTQTYSVPYGSAQTLTYSHSTSDNDDTITSWKIVQNGASTAKKLTTESYVAYATAEVVNVYVYAVTASSEKVSVKVADYFNRTQSVVVAAGTTVSEISGLTITFSDGQSVKAQSSPYITFNNWTVNGTALAVGYEINNAVTFKANGTKSDGTTSYTVDGGTFADGESTAVYKVDEYVTITASESSINDGCIGIAIRTNDTVPATYELVTYGSTYSFYAFPQTNISQFDFKVITEKNKAETIGDDYVGLGVYSAAVYNAPSVSVYSLATIGNLPEGVTVTERGVLLTRGDHTEEGFIKGSTGSRAYPSTKELTAPQYLITMKSSNPAGVYARAYVAYNMTVEFNNETYTLPLIVYGNIIDVNALV